MRPSIWLSATPSSPASVPAGASGTRVARSPPAIPEAVSVICLIGRTPSRITQKVTSASTATIAAVVRTSTVTSRRIALSTSLRVGADDDRERRVGRAHREHAVARAAGAADGVVRMLARREVRDVVYRQLRIGLVSVLRHGPVVRADRAGLVHGGDVERADRSVVVGSRRRDAARARSPAAAMRPLAGGRRAARAGATRSWS